MERGGWECSSKQSAFGLSQRAAAGLAQVGGMHTAVCSPFPCAAYSVDPNDQKKTACYDIDVEVDDPLKAQMSNFLASTTNQQEIASLDVKVGPSVSPTSSGAQDEGMQALSGIPIHGAPWDGISVQVLWGED